MTTLQQHILNVLAYFDIFKYPLKTEEIRTFLAQQVNEEAIDNELKIMLAEKTIFKISNFYSLHNDLALAERRRKGNEKAALEMKNAIKAARILSRFPYVKGLAVSGSLSKNFSSEKTDIDFFIITTAGRLWIARTCMHLYKKFTFLTGKQKWFCMNYYIDEAGLEIEEKNIYTAIEVATLLPMQGRTTFNDFIGTNSWTKNYFPAKITNTETVPEIKKGVLSRLIESLCNNSFGNWLDNRFMKITRQRWKKKEERNMKNDNGFNIGMLVDKHYSKPNPGFFQNKVIEMYKAKLDSLPKGNNISMAIS